MKKIQYLLATIVLGASLTSCGDSFLTQYPEGGLLLEEQYQKLPDNLEGAILGIYSKLYEYGGHSTFGLRSIDMYGDIQSGDMAMKKSSYGWFEDFERGYFYADARSYLWSFYYDIINLANRGTVALESDVNDIMTTMANADPKPSDEIKAKGVAYGQLLAIRGWAYGDLLKFYCNPMDALDNLMDDEQAVPIYTETEVKNHALGAPLASVTEVYDRVYEDLSTAIDLLDYYGELSPRATKLEVNADVARIMLAYAMLNHLNVEGTIIADGKNAFDIALEQAKAVIDGGKYPMLKRDDLFKTGFADVTAQNWIWGQDVTVETTTALGSFFGQVDIHTYSYAAAGDTKGIDSRLYEQIEATGWDARKDWFRSPDMKYPYCPDGKFYCPSTKNETKLDKVDRNWLCDNVFMRVEVAYLIAAEAAWRNGDNSTAENYLKALCYERLATGKTTADFDTWLGATPIKDAIAYNWRVEMWGEGYGMQTLRRLTKNVKLGTNHIDRANKEISAEGSEMEKYQCQIPTSEARYNPYLATTELVKEE